MSEIPMQRADGDCPKTGGGHIWVISGWTPVGTVRVTVYVCQECRTPFERWCGGPKPKLGTAEGE